MTSRTWPGINKPGGHGKIIKIHFSSLGIVDSLDVKYTLRNNTDTNLETDLVKAHVELDRGRRSRRSREFLKVGDKVKKSTKTRTDVDAEDVDVVEQEEVDDKENQCQAATKATKKAAAAKKRRKPCPEGPRPAANKKRKNKAPKAAVTKPKKINQLTPETEEESCQDSNDNDIPEFIVTKSTPAVGPMSPLLACTANANEVAKSDVSKKKNTSATKKSPSVSDEELEVCSKLKAASSVIPVNAAAKGGQYAVGYDNRKTLKSVYDGHVQEATDYINSLVGGCGTGGAQFMKNVPEKKAKSFGPPPTKTAEQIAEETRCQEFGKHFTNVMLQHDMAIPEDELLEAINRSGCNKLFTSGEMEQFVNRLCDQEKVMKSDGFLYSI